MSNSWSLREPARRGTGCTTAMLEQDDQEHPVPADLRGVFERIVEAFVMGDRVLDRVGEAAIIDTETAEFIQASIDAYGDALAPLDPAVWERSCYAWAGDHWQVLVDLTTRHEAVSDLTLHADVRLNALRVTVQSVHVP